MNTPLKTTSPGANIPFHATGRQNRDNSVRRAGSIRAVILDHRSIGADQMVGMTKALQESVDEAFNSNELKIQ